MEIFKKGYFQSYREIHGDKRLTPIERLVLITIVHYWFQRDKKLYPKYILKGKEKLAAENGCDRKTIKRCLDHFIDIGLITILNYDSILDKNRSLPQIVVNENNLKEFYKDCGLPTDDTYQQTSIQMKEETPKQESTPTRKVQNINYINEINKRLRDGN